MDPKQLNTILFFDSDCLFCNFWVQFILKKDKKKQIYFAPLQLTQDFPADYAEKYLFPIVGEKYKKLNTLYLYREGKVYEKSQAVLKICELLGGYFHLLLIFRLIPTFVSDFFYDLIAKNRHKIIKNSCALVQDERILK